MEKEFSKFQIAQLKRTAQNVEQSVKRKNKLEKQILALSQEYKQAKEEIEAWQAPIKAAFHGHTTEELVETVTVTTDKLDKNGRPIKMTKFVLKYPETIIPPTVIASESGTVALDDNDNVVEENENIYNVPADNAEAPINEPFNI